MFTPELRSTCEPCCSAGRLTADADREDREHRGEHHPAVPASRDHLPEHEDLSRRDQQDRQHLEEIRQAVRILEGVGRVRVVVPAAVRPELLHRDLRRDRAARDRLLSALKRRRRRVRVERLRYALRDQNRGEDHAERQQDVGQRPVEVDPEVADVAPRAARDAANDSGEDGHADRRRDEVLDGEAGHLRQVRHGRLAARRTASSCS